MARVATKGKLHVALLPDAHPTSDRSASSGRRRLLALYTARPGTDPARRVLVVSRGVPGA